jgi:hypothetical protein
MCDSFRVVGFAGGGGKSREIRLWFRVLARASLFSIIGAAFWLLIHSDRIMPVHTPARIEQAGGEARRAVKPQAVTLFESDANWLAPLGATR